MITKLLLENFKCFEAQSFEMRPLVVLAGLNGMGKSSVMQSLLALRQSHLAGQLERGYLLASGDLVDLGTASDILCENAKSDTIVIGLGYGLGGDVSARFSFAVSPSQAVARHVESLSDQIFDESLETVLRGPEASVLFTGAAGSNASISAFHYLQAERNGPRKFLPMARDATAASNIPPCQ